MTADSLVLVPREATEEMACAAQQAPFGPEGSGYIVQDFVEDADEDEQRAWFGLEPMAAATFGGAAWDFRNEVLKTSYRAMIASRPPVGEEVVDVLREALATLEEHEVKIDGEWGLCRSLAQIEADDDLDAPVILRIRAILAMLEGR